MNLAERWIVNGKMMNLVLDQGVGDHHEAWTATSQCRFQCEIDNEDERNRKEETKQTSQQ